ncbi:MAG TPA: discoidin domain-containing protein [Gaiellaceae bacterium]|nr:discoidin domain-containing protein [Gaiellaceae bacterium]
MLARSLVASAVVVLVMAAGGIASPAASAPANGRIVFGTFGRLISTNPDGTGQWPLTAEALSDSPEDWSPDGTRLLLSRAGDLYIADPRGRVQTRVTFRGGTDASFSPDGTRLLFEQAGEVWTADVDGSSPRRVPTGDDRAEDPAWSPDGRSIAWTSFRDGNAEIYVGNTDGSDVHRLTRIPGFDENPTFSPDGTRIAFDSDRDGSLDVYTMAVDGSDVHQLTTSPALDAIPEWSPDGREIAFMSQRTGERALFVMSAAGERQTQLSVFADGASGPAWQPLPREPLQDDAVWAPLCTIWGTPAADLLVGTPRADTICGLGGDDRILGGEGNDVLVGAAGRDELVGGPGLDRVSAGPGNDLIDLRDRDLDVADSGGDRDVALVDRRLDRVTGMARAFDPDPKSLSRGRPVRASLSFPDRPPEYAVDGHTRLIWGAGYGPAWIEIDLGHPMPVRRVQLVVAGSSDELTQHVVLGKGGDGRWRQLAAVHGRTHDGQVLDVKLGHPSQPVRWVRVATRRSPGWVAWKEIRVS